MSVRKSVYDGIIAALSGSTGLSHVTANAEQWWDWKTNQFPAACVFDRAEERTPISYFGTTTLNDMEAVMTVSVNGYVYDITNQNVGTMRSQLIADINRVMLTDSTLGALVADVWPVSVETDEGVTPNYGWCNCTFRVRYLFNHAET